MVRKRFRARLEPSQGGGAACRLRFDVHAIYGKARAPVRVKINGYEFRTTIAKMAGAFWLGINKEHRSGAGVDIGDLFTVTMELDTQPRTVEVPDDLSGALAARPELQQAWDRLSHTHQREHVQEIEAAKKPETRARRIERALEMLAKKTWPKKTKRKPGKKAPRGTASHP